MLYCSCVLLYVGCDEAANLCMPLGALNREEPHPDSILQAAHTQILGWELDAGTGWNFGVISPWERTSEALGE